MTAPYIVEMYGFDVMGQPPVRQPTRSERTASLECWPKQCVGPAMKASTIVSSIVAAIVGLGAIAYWDDGREAAASLEDFGQEQALLAREVAASMLAASTRSGFDGAAIHDIVAPIEEPGAVVALLRAPGGTCLARPSGGEVCMPRIQAAIDSALCAVESARSTATCSLRLSRDESVAVGLPPRTGMAGFATFVAPDGARHGVAIMATAARERDRERRGSARIVLSFLVASGLVLAFGMLALRKQRRELDLASELAVADAVRARDDRLVRADKLATMGALATGIAHEVATPLGVIVGRAEQLASKVEGDTRAARSVAAILEQAARIDEIIRPAQAGQTAPNLLPAGPFRGPRTHRGPARLSRAILPFAVGPYATESASVAERRSTRLFQ